MLFKPCIDLHEGKVKQIIGSTLNSDGLVENFISSKDSLYYSSLYKKDNLTGGHIIMLGEGNEKAAEKAIQNFPNHFQIGGGIHLENATHWIKIGAQKVILNSYLFENNQFSLQKLSAVKNKIGKEKITIDLSCKKKDNSYYIAFNKWQTLSNMKLNVALFSFLKDYCSEFLIHAVDVEGKQNGIDKNLVDFLIANSPLPTVYAGGIASLEEIQYFHQQQSRQKNNQVSYSIGSALDIFGGDKIIYQDVIKLEKEYILKKP